MDDKTVAPFALPPTEQVFGTQMETAQPQVEPQKRRRGRPAKAEGAPKAKRQGRKPAVKPAEGFTLDQVAVLRGLSHKAFSVVITIMKSIPDTAWREIAEALAALSPK